MIPRCSEFEIVAAYDNTTVKYTPTVQTYKGKPAWLEQTIILNKGDVYLVQSVNSPSGGDLSGTMINSDKPIGVFSGHVRTAIVQGYSYPLDSKDHLVEMLMPTSAWGRNFATAPFVIKEQLEGNLYRVFTKTPNNMLTIRTSSGLIYDILLETPGFPYQIEYINETALWSATTPIQIAQYMKHTYTVLDNTTYDPSLVMIPPLEQFVSKINFLNPSNPSSNPQQFVAHYASIIAEEKSLNTLRADGRTIKQILLQLMM